MSATNYRGIDYSGPGATCNRDKETGIRYGIISANELPWWWDSSEPDYGEPHCPYCGAEMDRYPDIDECLKCHHEIHEMSECYPDESNGNFLDDGEYQAFSDSSNDVWCVKSPYYTRAQFCSPCAPGACSLGSPCQDGEKAYCFGHDWFENKVAPYPVYSVKDDSLVVPECKTETVGA